MADQEQETQTVYARLTRDFPAGVTHRRGGIAFAAGPRPVQAEVTEEQLAALESDPKVQLVDQAEFDKWEERLGAEPEHPSAAELEADDTSTGTRKYEDDDSEEDDDEEEDDQPETAEQLVDGNGRDALVELAKTEGVEGLNFEDRQATTKRVIADAIVAKRTANTEE